MSDMVNNIKEFNDLELALMVLGALYHDLGMSIGEEDINQIKENNFFLNNEVNFQAYEKLFGEKAIQEIIRKYHAEISAIIIERDFKNTFILEDPKGVTYEDDVMLICECHTKDFLWLKEKLKVHNVKGKYEYNIRFIAHLIRIADLLDIDQSRTPFELYKLINPKGISDDEWRKHFVINNLQGFYIWF